MSEGTARFDPLMKREYLGAHRIAGPLLVVERAKDLPFGAIVAISSEDGTSRTGQVIDVSDDRAVVQILEETIGLDIVSAKISLEDREARLPVSEDLIGRAFDGAGRPMDGLPPIIPDAYVPISGLPINPISRARPDDFIQTGISAIDGFNTLLRGQKLPIFSGAGLPGNEIAAQILKKARVPGDGSQFVVVFAAIGITNRERSFFIGEFERSGSRSRTLMFVNTADDPTIERIMTPRYALAAAEYLAFEKGRDVLVLITDMTNYCEALREIGTAREEIPGRRGYPGYMYTDLASLYERAGRLRGRPGSVTLLPILTMPDDDIAHPIPDLTGYITEGQIFLSRQLHRRGVFPPIDVLKSLSRLMNNGIGAGVTREDHRGVANQLYACYAEGQDIRRLTAIVGEDALSDLDRRYLRFAELFELELLNQGYTERSIEETLDEGWRLLGLIPKSELRRLNKDLVTRYYTVFMEDGVKSPYA
ncbi:MAG: V-type ATP synthase subunit B [Treponemataceae bacterium]